jgi:hypothetical protein
MYEIKTRNEAWAAQRMIEAIAARGELDERYPRL